ncbi:MAG: endopeptidase La [Deltaproteobacteria bacterium]|nr:MAG: endopeptidase La [Deltaproteobacteria bacterium]
MTPEEPTSEEPETEFEAQVAQGQAQIESLPPVLPVLPLRNTVLFPSLVTPMVATTERAQRLIDDALAGDRLLVAVAAKDPEIAEPGHADLYDVGTVVRILRMIKTEEGTQRLWVQGLLRVKILEYESSEPYMRARVEVLEEQEGRGLEVEALQRNVSTQFNQIAEGLSNIPEAVRALVMGLEDTSALCDVVAANLGLSVPDRQELLEMVRVRERLERVSAHLAREQEVRRLEEEIRGEVQEELSRSQREYVLREQARAIRRQLGESESPAELVDELRRRLDALTLPDEVRQQAERELDRLAALPPGAVEAGTLRTYLEWIVDLPWSTESEDSLDVAHAREILDEDHYDIEKVKERILEFIAVLKLKRDMRGPILCFVGPPGTGKTSLGRSIARAMGREFARISLGGLRDEAEIRGHRRTYVASQPGRIIQTLRRVGSKNPVFMLDEIDKLGTDFRGDPSSALLEVLDSEQNHSFSDHYLEVPFDLSKVLFIATANLLEPIPPALRDRMEVIEIIGYTEEDKLEIAKRYLLPRQLERNGLADRKLEVTDEALQMVISRYTREAGLRNLERELGKIARKLARRVVEDEKLPDSISSQDLHDLLGPVRFEPEVTGRLQIPGVCVGLAVTGAGGEILFVEASRMPGKGQLKITGSIGDVMRESAQTAVALVRSRARELGIDPALFSKSNLHIHVPAGATPKDGPSAGIAIVVALTSVLLDRPVPPNLAMTGEITLRGKVLAVGGIKEKTLAAKRAGITHVLLPAQNEKDLVEIPGDRLADMKIDRIERIEEVLSIVFGKDVFV